MGRKKGNTRDKIIEESLKLFSVEGFEAVSIRTIADAVGIGNSALYKHFKNKIQALIDFFGQCITDGTSSPKRP